MKWIKPVNLNSEDGVANIIIAIFSSVFVASMILPLAAYHQTSLRSYVANKAKLESIENLERAAKAVVVSYQSSPTANRSISSIGASSNNGLTSSARCGEKQEWDSPLFCFKDNNQTVGAQFVKTTDTITTAGLDNESTTTPSGATVVSSGSGSTGGSGPTGGSWNHYPPRDQPVTQPTYPGGSQGGATAPSAGIIIYPSPRQTTEPIPRTPPIEVMDNRDVQKEIFELDWDEKLFLALDSLFPGEAIPASGFFSTEAYAVEASTSSASGPELGMGQTPSQWMTSTAQVVARVAIDYPANSQAKDLLLNCADSLFRCVEIKVCPSNIQASGECSDGDYFRQQVLLYN